MEIELYNFAAKMRALVEPITITISGDGAGEVYLPSNDAFEKISPQSQPAGLIFIDDSFLVFCEVIRFGYRDEGATEPTIYRLKYGYHYQRPSDNFYFRFDHHPDIGEPETHPLYHLHSAG